MLLKILYCKVVKLYVQLIANTVDISTSSATISHERQEPECDGYPECLTRNRIIDAKHHVKFEAGAVGRQFRRLVTDDETWIMDTSL